MSEILYFADAPTETLRIVFVLGGVPASDVPQYWHRAARFDDMFIAHTESRQRVRFALEHVVAALALNDQTSVDNKNNICVFIFSLGGIISEIKESIKGNFVPFLVDKKDFFVYDLCVIN